MSKPIQIQQRNDSQDGESRPTPETVSTSLSNEATVEGQHSVENKMFDVRMNGQLVNGISQLIGLCSF